MTHLGCSGGFVVGISSRTLPSSGTSGAGSALSLGSGSSVGSAGSTSPGNSTAKPMHRLHLGRRVAKDKGKGREQTESPSGQPVTNPATWSQILAEPLPPPKGRSPGLSLDVSPEALARSRTPEMRERPRNTTLVSGLQQPASSALPVRPKLVARGPSRTETFRPKSNRTDHSELDVIVRKHATQDELMSILQTGHNVPSQGSLFDRPPALRPPGSSRPSSRRTSVNTALIAPGSDPLHSILVLAPRASSSSLASSSISSPLRTGTASSFSNAGSSAGYLSSGSNGEGIPLLAGGNSLSNLIIEPIFPGLALRRGSAISVHPRYSPPWAETPCSVREHRRPSAPSAGAYGGAGRSSLRYVTPPFPRSSEPREAGAPRIPTAMTAFGAGLQTYRFGGPRPAEGSGPPESVNLEATRLPEAGEMPSIPNLSGGGPLPRTPECLPCTAGTVTAMLAGYRRMSAQSSIEGDISELERERMRREAAVSMWRQWAREYKKRNEKPSEGASGGSDRERDAPSFARALSCDSASLSSFDSTPRSVSTSRGRTGSLASLRYPLLNSSHYDAQSANAGPAGRHASADCPPTLLAMRPLPVSDIQTASRLRPVTSGHTGSLAPSISQNPFGPLRRRFMPNPDSRGRRVETQLLGELLLALEEYVAAYGRRIKVAGPMAPPSGSPCLVPPETGGDLLTSDAPGGEGPSGESGARPADDETDDSLSRSASARDPSALAEEVDQVAREVVEACPAFGSALTAGFYGPLAVRSRNEVSPAGERYARWAPGGLDSTRVGDGNGDNWWAYRLLRDLVEGLVGDGGWATIIGEEEVLTGALVALIEEDPMAPNSDSLVTRRDEDVRLREQELMERGKRRWMAFQERHQASKT